MSMMETDDGAMRLGSTAVMVKTSPKAVVDPSHFLPNLPHNPFLSSLPICVF